jgi:hypothetical protein
MWIARWSQEVKYFCGEQEVVEIKWQTPSKKIEPHLEMRNRENQRRHKVANIIWMKDAKRMG